MSIMNYFITEGKREKMEAARHKTHLALERAQQQVAQASHQVAEYTSFDTAHSFNDTSFVINRDAGTGVTTISSVGEEILWGTPSDPVPSPIELVDVVEEELVNCVSIW